MTPDEDAKANRQGVISFAILCQADRRFEHMDGQTPQKLGRFAKM